MARRETSLSRKLACVVGMRHTLMLPGIDADMREFGEEGIRRGERELLAVNRDEIDTLWPRRGRGGGHCLSFDRAAPPQQQAHPFTRARGDTGASKTSPGELQNDGRGTTRESPPSLGALAQGARHRPKTARTAAVACGRHIALDMVQAAQTGAGRGHCMRDLRPR
jgi:hypothetical protein